MKLHRLYFSVVQILQITFLSKWELLDWWDLLERTASPCGFESPLCLSFMVPRAYETLI